MSRSSQELLREALVHLELAGEYAAGKVLDQLAIDAICMRLSAGVEVLARLEADMRSHLFGDSWRLIWGMRHRIAHGYLLVDSDIVRQTIRSTCQTLFGRSNASSPTSDHDTGPARQRRHRRGIPDRSTLGPDRPNSPPDTSPSRRGPYPPTGSRIASGDCPTEPDRTSRSAQLSNKPRRAQRGRAELGVSATCSGWPGRLFGRASAWTIALLGAGLCV